ncbi:MAG: winged helix-turn-helix domain-containing protein, partial [Patescibacteria group bacterium]
PLLDVVLLRYGYIKKEEFSYIPFTPLLGEYLQVYEGKSEIPKARKKHFKPDEILLLFSKSQRMILELLKSREGEIVSRDDIAKALWGEGWEDRYSDWAIDQLLSSIREKMGSSRMDGQIITKKGEGIIFIPS